MQSVPAEGSCHHHLPCALYNVSPSSEKTEMEPGPVVRSPGQLLAQDNDWVKVYQAYGRATRKPKGVHAQTQPDPPEAHEAWQNCSQDDLTDLINTLPQLLLCTFVLTGFFVGETRVSGESPCTAAIYTLVICGLAIMVLHRQQIWLCSPKSAGDTWL